MGGRWDLSVKASEAQAARVNEAAELCGVANLTALQHLCVNRLLIGDIVAIRPRKARGFLSVDGGGV